MDMLSLKMLIFSPLIMALLLLLPIYVGHYVFVRRFAKLFAGIHFLYSLLFLVFFNPEIGNNFDTELTFISQPWLGTLGINLEFGIDGISLYLIILTSFIFFISCIASKGLIRSKHSLYYALLFIAETAVLGVFSSKDMFSFFLFWELELIPMYFLINLWGSDNSKKSAAKFLLYTFAGSLFMLVGFLMLYNFNFISTGELTANMEYLIFDYDSAPMYLQIIASVFIFIGFAVKLPLIPFHNWLPDAHSDAPVPISMILAAILLKIGAYGIIRFNIQIMPDAFLIILPYITILGFVNILYAACAAYSQSDIKRVVAYSSISVMGIVLLGICSLNVIGLSGALLLMIAHGIISAALFFIVGIIYRRTRTREISQLQGLMALMPRLSVFAIIIILAGIGVPGLISFPGEFLVFYGAYSSSIFNNYFVQIISISSIFVLVLSACYLLRVFHGVFLGEIHNRWKKIKDLALHEFIVLFSTSAIAIIFGIFPMVLINNFLPVFDGIVGSFGG